MSHCRDAVVAMVAPSQAVLFDLLMGIMDSLSSWTAAAGEPERGIRWRDAVTARMVAARRYVPYEALVADAAADIGLPPSAPAELFARWSEMAPWPDAGAVHRLSLPYGFITNTSAALARIAADRSGLRPRFTMSAEDAGWFKPEPAIYRAACAAIGSSPGETTFVAGSPYDAAGAHAAGLRARLVVRRADHSPPGDGIAVASSLEQIVESLREEGSRVE